MYATYDDYWRELEPAPAEVERAARMSLLYARAADYDATDWDALEAYAGEVLTDTERLLMYLGLDMNQGRNASYGERAKPLLEAAMEHDRATYRDELWRWMMDNERWEYVEYLMDKEGN